MKRSENGRCRKVKNVTNRHQQQYTERSRPGVTFGSRCGPVEQWWLGQERWRETKLGSGPRAGPARLGPGAINYNLIEGYRGDPAVPERRTEVVIEEGVLLSLSFQPGSSIGWNNIGLGEGLW